MTDSTWEAGVFATAERVKAKCCGLPPKAKHESGLKDLLPDGCQLPNKIGMSIPDILIKGNERVAYQGIADFVSDATARSLIPLGKNRDFLRSLVLTGGSVSFPGFAEAVENLAFEPSIFPTTPLVLTSTSPPRLTPYVGASILASLGSFTSFCVTREQYLEAGATAAEKQCP